jgi:hypothetical protein
MKTRTSLCCGRDWIASRSFIVHFQSPMFFDIVQTQILGLLQEKTPLRHITTLRRKVGRQMLLLPAQRQWISRPTHPEPAQGEPTFSCMGSSHKKVEILCSTLHWWRDEISIPASGSGGFRPRDRIGGCFAHEIEKLPQLPASSA